MSEKVILVRMEDYVLEQEKLGQKADKPFAPCPRGIYHLKSVKYAELLGLELELGYFIPCDKEGRPLETPKNENFDFGSIEGDEKFQEYCEKYEEAEKRVLFKDFHIINTEENELEWKKGDLWILPESGWQIYTGHDGVKKYGATVSDIAGLVDIELTEAGKKRLEVKLTRTA
jgi:hypothetical protein